MTNNGITDLQIFLSCQLKIEDINKLGNTPVIDPVVMHHVVPKSIKEFVDTGGTVIELF